MFPRSSSRPRKARRRRRASLLAGGSLRAPASEDEAPQREPQTERADGEAAHRERLAPRREALPAAEHLLLLGRERLAPPLLAPGGAGPEAQVHVVEDFRGLVGHFSNYSLPARCRLYASCRS